MRATPSTTEIHRIVFPQTSFSSPPSPSIPRWLLQECQDRKLCWSDCDKCLNKQLKRRRDFSEFTASAQFAWSRLAPLFLSLSKMLWQLKCVEDATHPTLPGSREWETGARYPSKEHSPWSPPTKFCFPVMTPLMKPSKVWLTEKCRSCMVQSLLSDDLHQLRTNSSALLHSGLGRWRRRQQSLMCKHKSMSSNPSCPCKNPCLKLQCCGSKRITLAFWLPAWFQKVRWRVIKLDDRQPTVTSNCVDRHINPQTHGHIPQTHIPHTCTTLTHKDR